MLLQQREQKFEADKAAAETQLAQRLKIIKEKNFKMDELKVDSLVQKSKTA